MSAATAPDPSTWRIQTAGTLVKSDKAVLAALKATEREIDAQLRALGRRRVLGFSAQVRTAQLQLAKRNMQIEQARLWRKIGDITAALRLEAASRVINVNKALDTFMLAGIGGLQQGKAIAQAIADAEQDAAERSLDRMLVRMNGGSYVPLSDRVYNSSVRIGSKIDTQINAALARGLSAKEFAKAVSDFINPATPGGLRYAALRLSRTEINNAAHAVAVDSVRDKPWVTQMRWHLSGSHPRVDICNSYAHGGPKGDGLYPKNAVPAKPHPQCFCFVTPEVPNEDEFLDNLIGGKYDDYISKYSNLAPGQIVRSDFGASINLPKAPKSTPPKRALTPAPKPKPVAPPAPKTVLPSARRVAANHLEPFIKSVGPKLEPSTRQILDRMADLAPRSVPKLAEFKVLNDAESRALAQATGLPGTLGGYYPSTNRLHLSQHIFRPGGEASEQAARLSGWFTQVPKQFNGYQGTIAHEFGHHMESMINRLPYQERSQFYMDTLRDAGLNVPARAPGSPPFTLGDAELLIKNNVYTIRATISQYGASSFAELLAESWAEYSTNPNARPYIKQIGERMKALGEKGAQR